MMWTKVDTRRPLVILLVILSALAWLALWLWGQSPYSRYLDHHNLDAVTANLGLMPLFVAGWVVMTIAMMLPTSLPLITLFDTLTRQRPTHTRLVMLLVGGYLAAWSLFGVVIYASDYVLHQIIGHVHWLEENAWLLGALRVDAGRHLSVHTAEASLPREVPLTVEFHHRALAWSA